MKSRCQGIINAEKNAARTASNFVESVEKIIESDKPEGHYAIFNSELYNKKLAEKEKEKTKTVDFIKYSPN